MHTLLYAGFLRASKFKVHYVRSHGDVRIVRVWLRETSYSYCRRCFLEKNVGMSGSPTLKSVVFNRRAVLRRSRFDPPTASVSSIPFRAQHPTEAQERRMDSLRGRPVALADIMRILTCRKMQESTLPSPVLLGAVQ